VNDPAPEMFPVQVLPLAATESELLLRTEPPPTPDLSVSAAMVAMWPLRSSVAPVATSTKSPQALSTPKTTFPAPIRKPLPGEGLAAASVRSALPILVKPPETFVTVPANVSGALTVAMPLPVLMLTTCPEEPQVMAFAPLVVKTALLERTQVLATTALATPALKVVLVFQE